MKFRPPAAPMVIFILFVVVVTTLSVPPLWKDRWYVFTPSMIVFALLCVAGAWRSGRRVYVGWDDETLELWCEHSLDWKALATLRLNVIVHAGRRRFPLTDVADLYFDHDDNVMVVLAKSGDRYRVPLGGLTRKTRARMEVAIVEKLTGLEQQPEPSA